MKIQGVLSHYHINLLSEDKVNVMTFKVCFAS